MHTIIIRLPAFSGFLNKKKKPPSVQRQHWNKLLQHLLMYVLGQCYTAGSRTVCVHHDVQKKAGNKGRQVGQGCSVQRDNGVNH